MPHECSFKTQITKRIENTDGIDWEIWTKTPRCECGVVQATRDGFPRRPYKRFSQPGNAARPEGHHYQEIATHLLKLGAKSTRWDTILKTMGLRIHQDTLRKTFLAMSANGAITICEKWDNRWIPWSINYIDRDRLQEIAHPGRLASVRHSISEYIEPLPECEAKALLLDAATPLPASWDAETVRIAGALIRHQLEGKRSLLRTFSTSLGESKLVGRHIKRLECILGSIGDYGIRRPSDMLFIAGHGSLQWPDGSLDMQAHHGAVGIERHRLRDLQSIKAQNILFVENKQAFTAVAEEAIAPPKGLVVYMAGNFGSTVEHMLRVSKAKPWMWADLDPYGVSFVRRAKTIRNDLDPFLMDVHYLDGENCKKLSTGHETKLDQELATGGVLQDLLVRIKEKGIVLEHEGQV